MTNFGVLTAIFREHRILFRWFSYQFSLGVEDKLLPHPSEPVFVNVSFFTIDVRKRIKWSGLEHFRLQWHAHFGFA